MVVGLVSGSLWNYKSLVLTDKLTAVSHKHIVTVELPCLLSPDGRQILGSHCEPADIHLICCAQTAAATTTIHL